MKKAKAIVTDAGGMTCHASIVSRELGIPCIVGTKSRSVEATTAIPDGAEITVDATNGIVYEASSPTWSNHKVQKPPAVLPVRLSSLPNRYRLRALRFI